MRTRKDRGASAVEFGLLLAAVAISVVSTAAVAGRLVYDALSGGLGAIGG